MTGFSETDEPFIFLCYARSDESAMRALARRLDEAGIKCWMDEGIQPGANWRDELSAAIQGSKLLLFLLSDSSARSKVCLQEIDFALECDTRILVVVSGQTDLPPNLAFRLGNHQSIKLEDAAKPEPAQAAIETIKRLFLSDVDAASIYTPIAPNPSIGEIAVTIGRSEPASDIGDGPLLSAVCRYVTWNGGAFRAFRKRPQPYFSAGYQLTVDLQKDQGISITWELVDSSTQQILWSHHHAEQHDSYSSRMTRIAEMIAEGVIGKLRGHRGMGNENPDRLSYWDLVLKSDHYQGLDVETVERQRSLLAIAIARFPDLAPAHAARANLSAWELLNGFGSDPDSVAEDARREASLALDLDANNPYVLVNCGSAHSRLGDYERGARLCRRAYSLAPTVFAKEALARSLCFAGQPDEAIDLFNEILDTMPAGQVFQSAKLVVPLIQANRLEEALVYSTQSTIDFPKEHFGWLLHANLLALLEEPQAREAFAEASRLMPDVPSKVLLAATERTYGRTPEQRHLLTGGIRQMLDDAS